jgi:hypothetical protein
MGDRPIVRCIVAWWPRPDLECHIRPISADERGKAEGWTGRAGYVLTLEEAAQFAELGFEVMVDPFDMEALTRWEQQQRAAHRFKSW